MMSRRDFKNEYVETREFEPIIREPYARAEQLKQEKPKKAKAAVGVVVNCERLNVRKKPNTASEVINILNKDDIVRIFHGESTNDFYKIRMVRKRERPLADETIEGFCMKTFIEVK